MSFEDDEYWESEYKDRRPRAADNTAVAHDPYAARRPYPSSSRSARPPVDDWDDDYDDYDEPVAPAVDELAARRQRRDTRYRTPSSRGGRVEKGFDSERPGWLDDPDFVPIDTSAPDLAGPDSAVLDFNRPELGAGFDAPEFPSARPAWQQRGARPPVDDDWDDEIDEPFDHRAGMDRRSSVRGLDGYVPTQADLHEDELDRRRPADPRRRPGDDRDYGDDREFADFDDPRRAGGVARPGEQRRRGEDPREADRSSRRGRRSRPADQPSRSTGRPGRPAAAGPAAPRPPAPRPADLPATGRARVPAPRMDDDFEVVEEFADGYAEEVAFEEHPPARGRVQVPGQAEESYADTGDVVEDPLDLYRPPRDRRRTGTADRDQQRPDAPWQEPDEPAAGAGRSWPAEDGRTQRQEGEPGRPGEETPAADDDGPRVISRAKPPAAPKVLSKATPPAQPRVIKKDEPAKPARIIGAAPPGGPAQAAPTSPAAPAASAGAPAAPPVDRKQKAAPPQPGRRGAVAQPSGGSGFGGQPADAPVSPAGRAAVARPSSAPPAAGVPASAPPVSAPPGSAPGDRQNGGQQALGRPGGTPTGPGGEAWANQPQAPGEPNRGGPGAAMPPGQTWGPTGSPVGPGSDPARGGRPGRRRPRVAAAAPDTDSGWSWEFNDLPEMPPPVLPTGPRGAHPPPPPPAGDGRPQTAPPVSGQPGGAPQPAPQPVSQQAPQPVRPAPTAPQPVRPAAGPQQAPAQPAAGPQQPAAVRPAPTPQQAPGIQPAAAQQQAPARAAAGPQQPVQPTGPQRGPAQPFGPQQPPAQSGPQMPASTFGSPQMPAAGPGAEPQPTAGRPAAGGQQAPAAAGPAQAPAFAPGARHAQPSQAWPIVPAPATPPHQLPAQSDGSRSAPADAPTADLRPMSPAGPQSRFAPAPPPAGMRPAGMRPAGQGPAGQGHAGQADAPGTRPGAPGSPGQPPMPPAPSMPTAGLDRGPRSAEPYALPPQVSPPQVHPRAEPTPINGYPASHARMPSSADAPLRAPQPDARPVSPARPPAHGRPETAADANGPWPQNQATPGGSAPATGLPHAGAGHMGAHAGPAAPVRPTFESPQAGQPFRDADSGAAQQPAGGAQHRSADSAPVQRKPVEQDPAPVARLATAGPQTQHHYADADLTPNWFTTKPSPEATTPDAPPAPTGPQNAGPQDAEATAQANAQEDPSRVVLDLDLVGLLNGMAPEQAIMATPENATGAAAQAPQAEQAPQGPHQDGSPQPAQGQQWSGPAFPSVMPGATPAAAPKPPAHPLRPLSAEDLEAIRWRLDGGTLREVVDDRDALREIGERLDEPLADETDNATRAGLLSVRAEVYRLLGELGLAAAAARLALAHAESAQDVRAMVIAQAELAHVLRLRGDFGEADRLFEQAAGSEAPELLRSVVHENAGRSCFDQGRHMEALDHFARAIRLGDPEDTDLAARTAVCLEAVYIHVLRDGWGPYPRLRREILGQPAAG